MIGNSHPAHRRNALIFAALVGTALLWTGCTFDRSGLADKYECVERDDCPVGKICIDGRCRVALDGGGLDALDDMNLPDAATEDADAGDSGSPSPCPGAENTCGGCDDLFAEPGTQCGGECGEGIWVCASDNAVVCDSDEPNVNPCGGCEPIDDTPGTPCGDCGEYRCDAGGESTSCSDDGFNDCGGCGDLSATPDTLCGVCFDGTWTCNDSGTAVTCVDASTLNACGGCGELLATPGTACGSCGGGLWQCATDASGVVCAGASESNACGGCGVLAHEPDTDCGPCSDGAWTCTTDDSAVTCVGASSLNGCGGCGELSGEPGTSCGACSDGTWACTAENTAVTCQGASETNSCGGCDPLTTEPGVECGTCHLDEFVCVDANTTACDGDTTVNECDGCTVIEDPPDTTCGPCKLDVFVCDVGNESTSCSGETYGNACEGCDELAGNPGDVCSCGGEGEATWLCSGAESVTCTDQNDSPADAVDLGSGNESASFTWSAWNDAAGDRDWRTASVDEDRADRRIGLTTILTRTDDDFTSNTTPVNYRLCVFYRYNDSRGADLGDYTCGYSDEAVFWDSSQGCLSPGCSLNEVFDASVDLRGCCESDYYGYTDRDGRFFRGWVTELSGIDQNTDGNPDDRGRAYIYSTVTNSISPAPTACDAYDAEIRF